MTVQAQPQNFTTMRGEDLTIEVTMDPVVDITAWTIQLFMRAKADNAPLLFSVAGTIVDGPAGVFSVTVPSATLLTLAVGLYRFDIWRTNTGGNLVLVYGICTIVAQCRFN